MRPPKGRKFSNKSFANLYCRVVNEKLGRFLTALQLQGLYAHILKSIMSLTASMMHSKSSDAPTRLVVFLGHRTSEDAPDAVPSGQYDPTGHLFWEQSSRMG